MACCAFTVGTAGDAAFIPIDEHDIVMGSVLVNVALRHKEIRHIFINAADLGEIFPHHAVVGAAEWKPELRCGLL